MLPASNSGAGMSIGFPDVCNTPVGPATAPLPYPNIGMNAQATPFSPIVKFSMVPALNMSSSIPMTSGDEGGVAHPTIKGPSRYTMGNPKVFVDKQPAINLACPTSGNNMNDPLGAVLVPSVTNVMLTFARGEAPVEGELSREELETLQADLAGDEVLRLDPRIEDGWGRIAIARFHPDLPLRVRSAVRELESRGARRLILDLRGNRGGSADAFVQLADDFLPRGAVICRVRDADGDERPVLARQDEPYRFELRLLIDGGTASAAELFAGCLQWHGRAAIHGEPSFGKASAQRLVVRGERTCMATAARFLLPDGADLHGRGVLPDRRSLPVERRPGGPLTDSSSPAT